jgi:hypothetical protein
MGEVSTIGLVTWVNASPQKSATTCTFQTIRFAQDPVCAQNATTPDSQRADVMGNGQRHRLKERVSWRKQGLAEH